ncbi:MAG: S1C family serine protease [Mycoplasmatales bacterium]
MENKEIENIENKEMENIENKKVEKLKKEEYQYVKPVKVKTSFWKPFFGGMLGALIIVLIFGVTAAYTLNTMHMVTTDSNSVVKTEQEETISNLYDNSVNSVITVVNQKILSVDNALLQEYINNLTNGEPIEQGIGSGFVYKKENGYYYALTNNHVVDGSDEISVITTESSEKDDSYIDAEILGTDEAYDIAVIRFKTSQDITPLEFADSDEVTPGQAAYAIGSPYGSEFQGSITSGIISAPMRTITSDDGSEYQYIQTDAAINPGNSGGPLLNSSGKVVGMNTMKIAEVEADNMGFSIPTNVVIQIASDIEENSKSKDSDKVDDDSSFEDDLDKLFG